MTQTLERRRAFRIDAGLHGVAYLSENREEEHSCFISNLSEYGCRLAVEQGGAEIWVPGKEATVEISHDNDVLELPGIILSPVELIETWGVSVGLEFASLKRELRQRLIVFMHSDHEQLCRKSVRLYARQVARRQSRRNLLTASVVLAAIVFALLAWRIFQNI